MVEIRKATFVVRLWHRFVPFLPQPLDAARKADLPEKEKEEEERCLDAMMEIERLKALKMYEEREKERLMDQRRGAKVIIEQIKDRQAQRMRMEEQRDQERAFILKQIEALKAEEVEQQRQKRLASARL